MIKFLGRARSTAEKLLERALPKSILAVDFLLRLAVEWTGSGSGTGEPLGSNLWSERHTQKERETIFRPEVNDFVNY